MTDLNKRVAGKHAVLHLFQILFMTSFFAGRLSSQDDVEKAPYRAKEFEESHNGQKQFSKVLSFERKITFVESFWAGLWVLQQHFSLLHCNWWKSSNIGETPD